MKYSDLMDMDESTIKSLSIYQFALRNEEPPTYPGPDMMITNPYLVVCCAMRMTLQSWDYSKKCKGLASELVLWKMANERKKNFWNERDDVLVFKNFVSEEMKEAVSLECTLDGHTKSDMPQFLIPTTFEDFEKNEYVSGPEFKRIVVRIGLTEDFPGALTEDATIVLPPFIPIKYVLNVEEIDYKMSELI
jgi:hypothetical protein